MTTSSFASHHLPVDGKFVLNESYAVNSSIIVELRATSSILASDGRSVELVVVC